MHEDPIVATAKDAIDTFKRSGLDYLALGDFLLAQAEGPEAEAGSWLA
jgi:predicted NodU family carbamoyl transferase